MAQPKKVHHKPATTHKRKAGLTAAAKTSVQKRKKKKHHKKKGVLSEMASPERFKQSGKAVMSGAVGGASVHVIEKVYPATWGVGARLLSGLLASFVTATVFDMPMMASGMAGAVGYKAMDEHLLAEDEDDDDDMKDGEFTDAEVLEEMPEYLSADGGVLMEDAKGNLYSLSERGQIQYYSPYNRQA